MDISSSFEAHRLFRNGVVQTILGSQFPGKTVLPGRRSHRVKLDDKASLIVRELRAANPQAPIVLMAHGMGGCSESGYMRRIAYKLCSRGLTVMMMNHRGSGPCMGWSDTLWNGGSSDDFDAVVQTINRLYPDLPLLLVGFSLSGNVLLKYLGEGRKVPGNVIGAFAVNPPIDLKVSSRLLSQSQTSWIFSRYYMNLLHKQLQALGECFPEAFCPSKKYATIWDFDVAYTAPAAGYRDVEEYYQKCSGKQFLSSIEVPTILLCAKDDPFVPPDVFDDIPANGCVRLHAPEAGGHMGYISHRKTPLGDRRWLDYVLLEWIESLLKQDCPSIKG